MKDEQKWLRRWKEPCPDCRVRAVVGEVGATEMACRNCGKVVTLSEPIPGGQPLPLPLNSPVVYYVRFGDRVKIGTTTNLEQRLQAIPCDEVLATEPGSYDVERQRHFQFRAARIYANREWFWMSDELRMHIYGLASA